MASRVGVPGAVAGGVKGDVEGGPLCRGHGIGVGAGMGMCIVEECNVGDVGGVIVVVGGTLIPSPSPRDYLASGVATISRVTEDHCRRLAIRQRWPRCNTAFPCREHHSRPTSHVARLELPQWPAC